MKLDTITRFPLSLYKLNTKMDLQLKVELWSPLSSSIVNRLRSKIVTQSMLHIKSQSK
jgi:hypothetical protein